MDGEGVCGVSWGLDVEDEMRRGVRGRELGPADCWWEERRERGGSEKRMLFVDS